MRTGLKYRLEFLFNKSSIRKGKRGCDGNIDGCSCGGTRWLFSCIVPDGEMDSDYVGRVRGGILEGCEQISAGLGIEDMDALREIIAEGGAA